MANNFKPPRIPKAYKADLNEVNEQLQDIATKMGNIADLGSTFTVNTKPVDDLTRKYSELARLNKKWADTLKERITSEAKIRDAMSKASKDASLARQNQQIAQQQYLSLQQKIARQRASGAGANQRDVKAMMQQQKAAQDYGSELQKHQKEYVKQKKSLDELDGKWMTIGKLIGNEVLGAIDKLGKSILSLGIDAVFASFNLVKGGVEKVYDLMQRTVKATGEFNEGLGGTTKGLGDLQKEGWKLEGALRGLSDAQLGIGLKELQEATHAFGFADKELSKFRETAVLAGKAMGIGNQTAGELARTFKLMGVNQKEIATQFVDISDAANDAGVPVADFGKEINSVKGFMTSFGKTSKKVFLDSAAFAKRLGVSLQSLEKFTDMTDTFESTAEAAAKMNTVFGTNINSMELMLEQDPSKRLEMVRKEFQAQGKTWEGMNRQERKFFAQTMNLSEEEAAAILENGMTLDQFQKKRDKEKKTEAQAQKEIQKGLLKTVSTLNNWSLTMDKITKAFAPLLKPLTDFLGITREVDKTTGKTAKGWKSFAERVDQVVSRIKVFFQELGKNEKVKKFIDTLTNDFKKVFGFLTDDGKEGNDRMAMLVDTIGNVVGQVQKFYELGKKIFSAVFTEKNVERVLGIFNFIVDHAGLILKVWAGLKVFSMASGVFKGVSAFVDLAGMLGGGKTFMKVISGFKDVLGKASTAIMDFAGKGFEVLKSGLSSAGGMIQKGFSAVMGTLTSNVGDLSKTLGGKAGLAGAVLAAGLAGWEFGTKLREWFPQIDVFMQKLMDGVANFFDNMWKKVVHTKFYQYLFGDDAAKAYDKADAAEAAYQATLAKDKALKEAMAARSKDIATTAPMPVKATMTGSVPAAVAKPVPVTVESPPAASKATTGAPVNFASKSKEKAPAGSKNVNIVAGDVYLDGNLVGRHIGRTAYEN